MGLGEVGRFPASVPFSGLVFLDAQPCLCIWQWEAALQPLQALGSRLGWKRGISCPSGYIPTFARSLGHLGRHRQNPGLWAPDLEMPSFSSRPTPRARSEEERRACQSAHLIKQTFPFVEVRALGVTSFLTLPTTSGCIWDPSSFWHVVAGYQRPRPLCQGDLDCHQTGMTGTSPYYHSKLFTSMLSEVGLLE